MDFGKYPIGTKAIAATGGYWEKTKYGWKWCTGDTFPRPGGDAIRYEMPDHSVRWIQNKQHG